MEKEFTADNGVKVYSYPNPTSHTFYISLFLRSGSMYEGEDESGITHFFEHIAIRNINHILGGGLYPMLDNYGLEFNAATYNEMVQFYISGAREHFLRGVEIISCLFSPISLPVSDINVERDRIRAEIREAGDKSTLAGFTQDKVWEGTPLSRSIMGTLGSVSRIGKRSLEAYRRRVFNKDNVFLYVTGNVDDTMLRGLVDAVGKAPLSDGEPHRNFAPVPAAFGKRGGRVYIKNADFTSVRLTFDVDMDKVSVPILDLIYLQLLGGYSSDFYIELSERRGLFYDLIGATERYLNVGTISLTYELREAKLYEALEKTVEILKQFKSAALPPEKYLTATYIDNAFSLYDDNSELNFTFAYDNHIMGLGYADLGERKEAYRKVTPDDILEAARCVFTRENLTLTVKGNHKRIDKARLEKIVSSL